MTKEELAAKIVTLIRAEAPEMAWPDVDTAVLMAAHEIRIGNHSNPPAAPYTPDEAGGNRLPPGGYREFRGREVPVPEPEKRKRGEA